MAPVREEAADLPGGRGILPAEQDDRRTDGVHARSLGRSPLYAEQGNWGRAVNLGIPGDSILTQPLTRRGWLSVAGAGVLAGTLPARDVPAEPFRYMLNMS